MSRVPSLMVYGSGRPLGRPSGIVATPRPSSTAERRSPEPWATAVDCASSRFCVAVGQVGVIGLVERWDGRAWSLLPALAILEKTVDLSPVTCPTSSQCTIVGTEKGVTSTGLVATLNGSRLTDDVSPGRPELFDVVRTALTPAWRSAARRSPVIKSLPSGACAVDGSPRRKRPTRGKAR